MSASTTNRSEKREEVAETKSLHEQLEDLYPYVYRTVRREIGDVPGWEDTVQEVYVSCLSTLSKHGFNGGSSLKTWLYRVIMRRVYDSLRQSYKSLPIPILMDYSSVGTLESPEDAYLRQEVREKIISGFFVLSPRERHIFHLFLAGWEVWEVAQFLKVSPRRVSAVRTSGLIKLRKLYGVKNGKQTYNC